MKINWGGGGGSCFSYCNCLNSRRVVQIKCFRDRVKRFIVNVLTIHYEMYSDKY